MGVIRCISDIQKPCVSKTVGFRVKDTSRSLCYPVYVVIVFHLVKQSAKPLGFLSDFRQTCISKTATRTQIWASGVLSVYEVLSRLKIQSEVIWYISEISDFH